MMLKRVRCLGHNHHAFIVIPGLWCALLACGVRCAAAQEQPYFVTYDDDLEHPGELEVSVLTTSGSPRDGSAAYFAPWMEFELGVTHWWTTELYVEGVAMHHEGSAFTGWRLENRFRLIEGEHAINPVGYLEYENVSEASRIQKEITGSGPLPRAPLAILNEEADHELEGRLILSSTLGRWNVSENAIVEKNFSASEGIEFGYSIGVARSVGDAAAASCRMCLERLAPGIEMYGGLGSTQTATFRNTRQFLAPTVAWHFGRDSQVKASVGAGLTSDSDRYLVRIAYSRGVR